MLETAAIKKSTLQLLKDLMADKALESFFLVGGTSIALQLGHRKSIDLDLFTQSVFDTALLNEYLVSKYGFKERLRSGYTLKGDISGVFVDCLRYPYPLLEPLGEEQGIRFASLRDVIAMKLSAITDNGTRVKDFVDIAYLSTKYCLNDMLSFYQKKFKDSNILSPVKALQFFDSIDFSTEPVELFNAKFNWKLIEKRISLMIQSPQKVFKTFPIDKSRSIEYGR